MDQLWYLIVGVIAGILSGLLGIGGGIIIVPALDMLFRYQHFPAELTMHTAIGTSFAIMIVTAASAAYAYHRRGLIIGSLFVKFVPGLLLGTIAGSIIARELSSNFLRITFAIFMIIIAIDMFFPRKAKTERTLPRELTLSIIAFFIGIFSGFFGIGGGSLMVPFFVYCAIEMHEATGTSSLCGFPLAIIGTISLILTGWHSAIVYQAPSGTTGYVYWPAAVLTAIATLIFAPIGTRLAVWLPAKELRRIFAIVLLITAINLLYK